MSFELALEHTGYIDLGDAVRVTLHYNRDRKHYLAAQAGATRGAPEGCLQGRLSPLFLGFSISSPVLGYVKAYLRVIRLLRTRGSVERPGSTGFSAVKAATLSYAHPALWGWVS